MQYKFNLGVWGSPWIGFDNFTMLFKHPEFLRSFQNTIIISFNMLLWGFPAPILLALLLNELRGERFKRISQSVLYLPHFLSWVIMTGIIFSLFSASLGVVNKALVSAGLSPWSVIGNPATFRPMLYISSIWKSTGYGTIIFMAAITGIDPALYEAAYVDGANRFKQCIYITLPSLKYAIITLLILRAGGMMNSNFEQIINLLGITTRPVGEVIDTLVYRMGVVEGRYDFATAVELFKQVINCALLFFTNWVVERMGEEGFV